MQMIEGKLVRDERRAFALEILKNGLKASDPYTTIKREVKLDGDELSVRNEVYNLTDFEHIYVIGAGKASGAMAVAIEEIMGKRLTGGRVNVKSMPEIRPKKIELQLGDHPIPGEKSIRATGKVLEILERSGERDLVINLISGGGSSMLFCPVEEISAVEMRGLGLELIKSGASINEINCVRKHISQVKGGRLAARTSAKIITLIISDVVGDRLDSIASGPTAADPTTFSQAISILKKYRIGAGKILEYLKKGEAGEHPETPKEMDSGRVSNFIIGSNRIALTSMAEFATERGYEQVILSDCFEGEAREIGSFLGCIGRSNSDQKVVFIGGGEATVTVKGKGEGGPNMELLAGLAISIKGIDNITVAGIDSDGEDGSSRFAGAIIDGETVCRAESSGICIEEELENNNSLKIFDELKDAIIMGQTGTNVNALWVMVIN